MQSYEYSAFGELKRHGHKVKQPYAYTGREWDQEIELYFYRARFYDPAIGRFISKDPIGFAGGINPFVYALNNPINYIDPYGLWNIGDAFAKVEMALEPYVVAGGMVVSGAVVSGAGAVATVTGYGSMPVTGPAWGCCWYRWSFNHSWWGRDIYDRS